MMALRVLTGLLMAISVQSFAPTFIPAGKVSTMPFTSSSSSTSLDARRINTKKEKRKRNRENMRAFRKRGGSNRKIVQKQLSNDQRQIENEFIAKCFMTIPLPEKDVDDSFGFGGNVMGGRPGGRFPTPNTKAVTSTAKRQLSFRGVGETARVCKWWLDNPPEVQAERLTSPEGSKGEGEESGAEKVVVGKGLTVVFDLENKVVESTQAKKRRALREAMSAKPPAAGELVPQV